jgi:hypothetical protein
MHRWVEVRHGSVSVVIYAVARQLVRGEPADVYDGQRSTSEGDCTVSVSVCKMMKAIGSE